VNFNGAANSNLTGTYARTSPSTTVTVTITAHGLKTGDQVFLDFTSGTGLDGAYTVTVTNVNTFTVTTVASTTTSGNVTLQQNTIRASGNVSSVSDNGTGNFTMNFATAMPDANYCASGSGQGVGGFARLGIIGPDSTQTPTASSFPFRTRYAGDSGSVVSDLEITFVAIHR
jgi:hypothetical protein